MVYAMRSAQLQRGPRVLFDPQHTVLEPPPPTAAAKLTGRLMNDGHLDDDDGLYWLGSSPR
jgi:hypothetical protein